VGHLLLEAFMEYFLLIWSSASTTTFVLIHTE